MAQFKIRIPVMCEIFVEAETEQLALDTLADRTRQCASTYYDDETDEIIEDDGPNDALFEYVHLVPGVDGVYGYYFYYEGQSEDVYNLTINQYEAYGIDKVTTLFHKQYGLSSRFKKLSICPSCNGIMPNCTCRTRNRPPWIQQEEEEQLDGPAEPQPPQPLRRAETIEFTVPMTGRIDPTTAWLNTGTGTDTGAG